MAIGYAGNNGHTYVALGKVMREQGLLAPDNVSLQTIKQWLYDNPGKAREMMEQNPRFIFFRELKDGMIRGAQGVGLTPMRSLAVDPAYIPYGMPVFLETTLPDGTVFNRLMIAQDTGSAIKGAIRGDIYMGSGKRAEELAGRMANKGSITLLVPSKQQKE